MSGNWRGSDRSARLPKDWLKRRAKVLKRDPICRICKANPSVQVDHIQAGDDHSLHRLQGVCGPCHRAKSSQEGIAALRKRSIQREPEQHPGLRVGGDPLRFLAANRAD